LEIDIHLLEENTMNSVRLFAFTAAVLLTVLLCSVIAAGLTDPASIHAAAAAAATAPSAAKLPQPSADY
jgi:hypothetical protein